MPQPATISVPQLETQKTRALSAIGIGVAGAVVMAVLERGSITSMIEYAGIFVLLAIVGVIALLDVRKRLAYLNGTQCVGRLSEDPKHTNAGSVSFLEMLVQYPDTDGKIYAGKARLYLKGNRRPAMAANSEVPVFYKPAAPGDFAVYVAECGIARGSASPV